MIRGYLSCLLDELGIDPQVRADQMGHTVDVNHNKYTRSSLERRRAAVNALEQAVRVTEVQEQIGANSGGVLP